jgi:hypothetical protein
VADSSSSVQASPPPPSEPLRNGRAAGTPIFLLALLIGLSVHLGVLVLFHFTVAPPNPTAAAPAAPYIHYNDIAHNPALLALVASFQFSPEQIYLSAEKGFSSPGLPRTDAPSHPVFNDFTIQPTSSEVNFHQPIQPAAVASGPSEALKPLQSDLLNSFGQAPTPGNKLPPRGAFVRITRLETRGQSTSPPIDPIVWPPFPLSSPPAGSAGWQPVSFILQFNAAGLASEPVLDLGFDALSSSGTPNDPLVNNFLRDTLRDWFTKNPPLPPGQYEAVVGP